MVVTPSFVYFVLPFNFCAHWAAQKPGVRGQFRTRHWIVVGRVNSSSTRLWPPLPAQNPNTWTRFGQLTDVGHWPPPAAMSAVTSKASVQLAPFARLNVGHVMVLLTTLGAPAVHVPVKLRGLVT